MIEIENLTKTFGRGQAEVKALDGVSLDIKKGEFVGINGPSGSGKTTLLHLLGLLDDPTSGSIHIDGIDVCSLTDWERTMFRLYKLGYVFQDYALVPELTVKENICLPAMLRKDREEKEYIAATREILHTIGLWERRDHLQSELSGGQQQRVAIARAIVNTPDILFADEPCANLDTQNSRMVLELFRKINRERGQTIVMVSHEDWHTEYFDRVVRLKDGKLVNGAAKAAAEPNSAA